MALDCSWRPRQSGNTATARRHPWTGLPSRSCALMGDPGAVDQRRGAARILHRHFLAVRLSYVVHEFNRRAGDKSDLGPPLHDQVDRAIVVLADFMRAHKRI